METKKEITYNYNEFYYMQIIIPRMERINEYLISDKNFPFALEEFNHWFIELGYEIETFDVKIYKRLEDNIKECELLIVDYDKIIKNRQLSRKEKPIMLKEIEDKIRFKLNCIYRLIMESQDKLNMFLKKEKKDSIDLAVYS